jgi:hypothetical protein
MKNIEQEVLEAHADNATSDALPQNISHKEPSAIHPASPKSNDSEKTISDQIHSPPIIEPVVKPVIEPDVQHASSGAVEFTIPEQEKAKLQKLAMDLDNPSPRKLQNLTPGHDNFIKSFE